MVYAPPKKLVHIGIRRNTSIKKGYILNFYTGYRSIELVLEPAINLRRGVLDKLEQGIYFLWAKGTLKR